MADKKQKPIKIIYFHAYARCGYCTAFKPTWEELIATNGSDKNIDFDEYDEADISSLPYEMRTVDGEDVRKYGYPGIKIIVNEKNYMYLGRRTPEAIYRFILGAIKNPLEISVKDSDNKHQARGLDETLDTLRKDIFKSQSSMNGGGVSKIASRKITDDDFKFMNEITNFSEVAKIK